MSTFKACIVGASGYTGAQLAALLHHHPAFSLEALFVSPGSQDAGRPLGHLHGEFAHLHNYHLAPLLPEQLPILAAEMDVIFFATPHEASHDWVPLCTGKRARIFDLSGAFRLKNNVVFEQFYGFEHKAQAVLDNAVYGLAEWFSDDIANASVVAVPGCYPTASLSALMPLQRAGLLDPQVRPVINAVSGVSGAGRKAALTNSFCEVSLQAYGVLQHRHTPEIEAYLQSRVIFTPHLGNFKRGILATVTAKLTAHATEKRVEQAFHSVYREQPLVRLRSSFPRIDDVAHTPFVDLHWRFDPDSQYMVVTSAIDNLLKGAASQAVQCANITLGLPVDAGLGSGCR